MKVKICGVTTAADARLAVDLGADFVGLNFYRPSPRWIDVDRAARLRRVVGDRARAVGIFVNHSREQVEAIDRQVGLDYLQFSGDESPEFLAGFSDRAIRVLRIGGAASGQSHGSSRQGTTSTSLAGQRDVRPGSRARAAAAESPSRPASLAGQRGGRPGASLRASIPDEDCWAVLIDRAHKRLYGGSGESWDYAAAADLAAMPGTDGQRRRVFLAGGVGPDNVADVAAAVPGAYAVDTCSGVESSPGHKDRAKLEQLFANLAGRSAG